MKNKAISDVEVIRFKNSEFKQVLDFVSVEEPLEISLAYWKNEILYTKNISITMRTPDADKELALGFLVTEGILTDLNSINKIEEPTFAIQNKITIELKKDIEVDLSKIERHFYTSSSCGVCGKSSIDSIRTVKNKKNEPINFKISKEVILGLNEKINSQQAVFEKTGGLHASSLFTIDGDFIELFEDVGRHNALDKLIGSNCLKKNFPLAENILLLSGRISFELIQKAAMANISVVCALGAPSSLAIELAKEFNMTLIGFLKKDSFNIYNGSENIL